MKRLTELMDLQGRCALLTGGAGHMGLAIGEALVELGASVAIVDRDADRTAERAAALNGAGRGLAIPVPMDLSDESQVRAAVKATVEKLGSLDILVHAAAYVGTTDISGWSEPFERQTVEAWNAAMQINLTAGFLLVREAKTYLEKSGRGSIIFIGSIHGLVGPDMRLYEGTSMTNPAGYAASKGGLLQLTRYFATLLAPKIRVNAISPGGVWRGQPEIFVNRYVARTPLERMGKEEDVKGAVGYLASDLSDYVTGENIMVDGGWMAW